MFEKRSAQLAQFWKSGYVSDPSIELLFDKSKIAQIKVKQLEMVIQGLEAELEIVKLRHKMLKEEYKF
jgi:hypothetical protein